MQGCSDQGADGADDRRHGSETAGPQGKEVIESRSIWAGAVVRHPTLDDERRQRVSGVDGYPAISVAVLVRLLVLLISQRQLPDDAV
jgi:hypothetical protein